MSGTDLVRVDNLSKIYSSGGKDLVIFRDLTFSVAAGEMVAVIGESGAGKSTLLHLISGLDRPTGGRIFYKEHDVTRMAEAAFAGFRNREIGYVWQQHHLLPEFTAEENTSMPLMIRGESRASAFRTARHCLEEVGLLERATHRAGELSGGEQQRIAIARALAGNPSLLLADEPTGNLDEATGQSVFALLKSLRASRSLTVILVTHNLQFAGQCDRVLRLERGLLTRV